MPDKKIGARWFRMGQILATEAIKMQVRLMGFAGPALDKLPDIFAGRIEGASPEALNRANAQAMLAVGDILSRADPDAVASFLQDVCEMAMISDDGKTYENVVFDHHMSGPDMKDILPLTIWVIREALGDFFTGLPENLNPASKTRG